MMGLKTRPLRLVVVLAVAAVAGTAGCHQQAAVGVVVDRQAHYIGSTRTHALVIRQADGSKVRVRVAGRTYDRCHKRERYPECGR